MKTTHGAGLPGTVMDEEALIREARQRQRRRRLTTGVAVVLALAVGLGTYAVMSAKAQPRPKAAAVQPGHRLAPAAATSGPPRYYATEESWHILVRKTATGAVTARIPSPYAGRAGLGMLAMSVAAAGGGQEFVAAYTGVPPHGSAYQTRLYSFHLTSAGHAAGLSLVKGGVISGLEAGGVMAVSPDGLRIALAVYRPAGLASPPSPAGIVVVDLRTGAHLLWEGGLQRPALAFSIPSISWGPGGRFLVFLGQWCQTSVAGGFCGTGPRDAQVRTLRLAGDGGRLSQGSVLLAQSARNPDIVQALLTPGGKALTLVVLRGPYLGIPRTPQDLRVVRLSLARGARPRLLYHGVTGDQVKVALGSDASGRYLLLAWGENGWISHGTLHRLAPQGGYAFLDAW